VDEGECRVSNALIRLIGIEISANARHFSLETPLDMVVEVKARMLIHPPMVEG
jgi:hypothetical protein